ncbi:MAG: hypothetical protein QOE35_3299 [Actinomycetota bacterium]|jgi:hypothetical protein
MKRLLFVLGTAAFGLAAFLALTNAPLAGGAEPPRTPQCAANDQLLAIDTQRSGDAVGSSPEDAIDKEILPLYANLPSSAFTKTEDDTGRNQPVEFVHHENGRLVVVLEAQKFGSGWGVDEFQACNSALQPNEGGGSQ